MPLMRTNEEEEGGRAGHEKSGEMGGVEAGG